MEKNQSQSQSKEKLFKADSRMIAIYKGLTEAIEEFLKQKPEYGYHDVADFIEDAARRRLEELKT